MALGSLRHKVTFFRPITKRDTEGFSSTEVQNIYETRAMVETLHFSERWLNQARFLDATIRLVIRKPKSVSLKQGDTFSFQGARYEILSIEDVALRGRFLEIMGKDVRTSGRDQSHAPR